MAQPTELLRASPGVGRGTGLDKFQQCIKKDYRNDG
jgi:hypothetical protein